MERTLGLTAALGGAWLCAHPTIAEAAPSRSLVGSVFVDVRATWTAGKGIGIGVGFEPMVVWAADKTASPAFSTSVVLNKTRGQTADLEALALLGATNGLIFGFPQSSVELWAPMWAVVAGAGARWADGARVPVAGLQSTGLLALRLGASYPLDGAPETRLAPGLAVLPAGMLVTPTNAGRPVRDTRGHKVQGEVRTVSAWKPGALEWARRAREELAALRAFAELGRHLAFVGAPLPLQRSVRQAARDELRHARICLEQAARAQGEPIWGQVPPVVDPTPRSLGRLAAESWLDGWQNEGEAAAEGAWRARVAADPAQRRTEAQIAREEAEHARLGRRIAAWAEWTGGNDARTERDKWLAILTSAG